MITLYMIYITPLLIKKKKHKLNNFKLELGGNIFSEKPVIQLKYCTAQAMFATNKISQTKGTGEYRHCT